MFAKKSLGQNFLMHAATAERIADAAAIQNGETVLEIGPGTGMLTSALLKRAGKVVAVEADDHLVPTLSETFAKEIQDGKLVLIHTDIRSFDPSSISESYSVVANIPYYITGEIIRQFLTAKHQPKNMTLLVQKEVAERVARSTKESLLSLSVKAYGTPKYMFTVPRGSFKPAPKVDSAVLSIRDISRTTFDNASEERFFEILRAGFAQKRKQLGKNLSSVAPQVEVEKVLASLGVSGKARAEDVILPTWVKIAETL